MIKPLIIAFAIALASCAPVQTERPFTIDKTPETGSPVPSEERAQEIAPIDIAALVSGTGALAERLLPTGIIDIGRRDAPVTLLLFTGHHSRYARDYQSDLFPLLYSDFIEPGALRFQIAILPLRKYPQSETAAAALLCSAMQSRGFAMHQLLSEKLEEERLEPGHYAGELGLNATEFDSCMAGEETDMIMNQQRAWASSLGVTLVPTFFLNGEKHVGLPYYADLKGMIEEKINGDY